MNYGHKRGSSSPLIDPVGCSLVVIAPHQPDFESTDPSVRASVQGNLAALTSAADIVNVPIFVLSRDSACRKDALVQRLRLASPHRHFACEEHSSPWLNIEFVDALAREDCATLILSDFWLEHQILATALHALAESYDVYFPIDATPVWACTAEQPTRERLAQAGATPVVTSQVIHEWSLAAPDATARAALFSFLVRRSDVDTC